MLCDSLSRGGIEKQTVSVTVSYQLYEFTYCTILAVTLSPYSSIIVPFQVLKLH